MTSAHPTPGGPTLCLELPAALARLAEPRDTHGRALRDAVAHGLGAVMSALGIPGRAQVDLSVRPGNARAPAQALRASLDGTVLRYPDELLVQIHSHVREQPLDARVTPAAIVEWLQERCATPGEPPAHGAAVEFLALLCVEVVKRHPALLFGPAQACAYADALASVSARGPCDPQWLRSVLAPVLAQRISIADRAKVAAVLDGERAAEAPDDSVVESLIDALCPDVVEIRASTSFLRAFTVAWEHEGPEMFPFLREGMFEELGLRYPPLRFVASDDVKAGCFAFTVNHLESLPLRSLRPDQCLVNELADRLRQDGVEAIETLNPATFLPNSIVAAATALPPGLTTWNPFQHLVLCLAELLRRDGWCLFTRRQARGQLEALAGPFPRLVQAARARGSDERLTRLLRDLLRERVCVKNLRAILEHGLDVALAAAQTAPAGAGRTAPPDDVLACVRIGLAGQIADKAAASAATVVVYLLDEEIERLAAGPSVEPLDRRADDILDAIRRAASRLPRNATVPHLLTFVDARRTLQQLIADEFPRVSVLAHEELPPGTLLMPIERIVLDESAPAA